CSLLHNGWRPHVVTLPNHAQRLPQRGLCPQKRQNMDLYRPQWHRLQHRCREKLENAVNRGFQCMRHSWRLPMACGKIFNRHSASPSQKINQKAAGCGNHQDFASWYSSSVLICHRLALLPMPDRILSTAVIPVSML
ncbi:MAG: hypothetical protein RIT07_1133, partial [Bacteroidota bacterium]